MIACQLIVCCYYKLKKRLTLLMQLSQHKKINNVQLRIIPQPLHAIKYTSCSKQYLADKDSLSDNSTLGMKLVRWCCPNWTWRCLGAIKLKMLKIEVFHWAKASQGLYEVFKAKLLHFFQRWHVKHPLLGVYFLK